MMIIMILIIIMMMIIVIIIIIIIIIVIVIIIVTIIIIIIIIIIIEGATPLDRSVTATSGGLAGDGQRAVTTLLWIDGGSARGDPRGHTVTGTVRPPPTDNRGRVEREVRIVDKTKL